MTLIRIAVLVRIDRRDLGHALVWLAVPVVHRRAVLSARHGVWLSLTKRRRKAQSVVAAVEDFFECL